MYYQDRGQNKKGLNEGLLFLWYISSCLNTFSSWVCWQDHLWKKSHPDSSFVLLMTLETEKVVKNLSRWQMPYFVIVRRGIAQIKFITETECVLYFGYCERKHGTEWFE